MRKQSVYLGHKLRIGKGSVDRVAGVIHGAVAAEANVNAEGHFAYKHADGSINFDPEGAVKKLQIRTDQTFLAQLVEEGNGSPGGVVRARIDHDDAVKSRLGYVGNFRLEDNVVRCDVNLLASAKDREIVLDSAERTPEHIGLSIDFLPSFEEVNGEAIFRIDELYAVDVVDRGAVTPNGLFLSVGVDTSTKLEKQNIPMPEETKEPTLKDVLAALTKQGEEITALKASLAAVEPKKEEKKEEVKEDASLSAKIDVALQTKLAAMGIRPGASTTTTAAGADSTETEKSKQKTEKKSLSFKEEVSARLTANPKLGYEAAVKLAKKEAPEAYRASVAHLFKPAA